MAYDPEKHDPRDLRHMASCVGMIYDNGMVRRAFLAYADLIERHAKLLKHAEAMAGWIEANEGPFPDPIDALVNFRADFKKE